MMDIRISPVNTVGENPALEKWHQQLHRESSLGLTSGTTQAKSRQSEIRGL